MVDIFSYLKDISASMNADTTLIVKVWMTWMSVVFLASLYFVRKFLPARLALMVMMATIAAVLYIWHLTKNIHLFGVAHILFWFPLAVYLLSGVVSKKGRETYKTERPFFIWICLLLATIVISLIFDVRDLYLVMMGVK